MHQRVLCYQLYGVGRFREDVLFTFTKDRHSKHKWMHSFLRVSISLTNFLFSGIFKETYRKVPIIVAMPKTRLDVYMCNLKGDTVNDADTAGILGINADIKVRATTLAHLKSGGIMLQCLP